MRFSVLRRNGRLLARGAAVILVCGAAAGCSSSASRFGGLDDMFTASTPKAESTQAAPLASAPAGSVSRSSLEPAPQAAPVARNELPAPSAEPVQPAPAPRKLAAGEGVAVQSGDTIYGLARRHGVPPEQIMAANGLNASSSLKIGQRLVIPGVDAKSVATAKPPKAEKKQVAAAPVPKPTASPAPQVAAAAPEPNAAPKAGRIAGTPPQTLDQQAQAAAPAPAVDPTRTSAAPAQPAPAAPAKATAEVLEESQDVAALAPEDSGIGKMRWPVRGKVVSNFGSSGGKASDGIDIAVPAGTAVKAAENGVVIYAGDGLKEFGNTVLVRHEDGLVTVYGHASELKVARGEKVKRGQEIATSGMTGNAGTPKLHFEVRKNSAPVDPKQYLE
ncbi:MAG TPA: peptidoglycan DD-metalloendopeptidase family protein [Mesorhizobium sp.]|jgi:murein DD-endopeptidase MepM/ murein hydrolase activator NlpD|nr:peptidoglycan DD-metalloendopeptidase family protein [Mesorhizobium sp.]